MIRFLFVILALLSVVGCKQYADQVGSAEFVTVGNTSESDDEGDYETPPHSFGQIPAQPLRPAKPTEPPPSPKPNTPPKPAPAQPATPPAVQLPPPQPQPEPTKPVEPTPAKPSDPPQVPVPMPPPPVKIPQPQPEVPPPAKDDKHVESGVVIPTVYYLPVYDNAPTTCPVDPVFRNNVKVKVHGTKGEVITEICKSYYFDCAMQGSCVIVDKTLRMRLSVVAKRGGVHYFRVADEGLCPHGETGGGICVDPFYSVAADLRIYNLGDVFFIPALVDMVLPNGGKHDGYFIVRDTGSAIRGKGRFDFYTGYYGPKDPNNPFLKYRLNDKTTQVPYYKVNEEIAKKVRASRNYPRLPVGASIASH